MELFFEKQNEERERFEEKENERMEKEMERANTQREQDYVRALERENRQANLTHERETRQQNFMREQFAMMAQLHGQMIHAINGFFQGASTHSGPHVAPQMQAASEAAVSYQSQPAQSQRNHDSNPQPGSSFSDIYNVTNSVLNQKF